MQSLESFRGRLLARGVTRIKYSKHLGKVLELDQDEDSMRGSYPTAAGSTEDIVHAVLAALKREPVWAWAQEQVDEIDRGQQDDGAEMPQDPSELDELADEEMGPEEFADHDPDEGADLDSLGADLDEAEEDLGQAEEDEDLDEEEAPVRMSNQPAAAAVGQAAQRHLHRMSRRLAATTAGQAAAQRHLERDGNDHPLRLMDGARSRGRRDPHAGLRRYEARFKHGSHDRYSTVQGYRGRLTEPTPTDEMYGDSVPREAGDVRWKSMDQLLSARGDPTTVRGTHPDETSAGHPQGTTRNVYETQQAAQRMAESMARAWIERGDVSQQSRDEAGRYCSDPDQD
jgi:hypothetical protein